MATQITADLPTLDFPREVDYPTQEDWAAFSSAAEENFGILGGDWSTQMQLWKDQANAMSIESNTNSTIAQGLANYQGDWVSQGYTLGQTVSVSGIYYICKLTHATGQNPTDVDSSYWNLAIGNWYGNFGTGTQSFNGFGGSGFKNLILNGNKQVNQRGLTSTDNSYNYDMHYKAGNNWYLPIEGINLISGKKYTLSWVGVATASYYVGTATSSTINAQSFTFIANGSSIIPTITTGQNLWIKFASNATGSTFNFVQLEEGSVATPFENRPYGLELSLCQRYYETGLVSIWQGQSDTYRSSAYLNFKNQKRVSPSISLSFVENNGYGAPVAEWITADGFNYTAVSNTSTADGRVTNKFIASSEL